MRSASAVSIVIVTLWLCVCKEEMLSQRGWRLEGEFYIA